MQQLQRDVVLRHARPAFDAARVTTVNAEDTETTEDVLAFYTRACGASDAVIDELAVDALGTAWYGDEVTLRWVLIHMIEETARHVGHLDIVRELADTERARQELDSRSRELARSNSDLEQFAYVASHDLQEPLRKVASFTQLLQKRYGGQLDERADQYIDFAVDGAKRMQRLIQDLLGFSRVGRITGEAAGTAKRRQVLRMPPASATSDMKPM